MKPTLKIEGIEDIRRLWKDQPRLARRAARSALRSAIKPALQAARATAPVDTGFMRDELTSSAASNRDLNNIGATIGAKVTIRGKRKKYANNKTNRRLGRAGAKYTGVGPGYYARFTEFGFTAPDGTFVQGTGWMQRAFEASIGAMLSVFSSSFRPKFEAAVANDARRQAARLAKRRSR